jgi:hypothetical protein
MFFAFRPGERVAQKAHAAGESGMVSRREPDTKKQNPLPPGKGSSGRE